MRSILRSLGFHIFRRRENMKLYKFISTALCVLLLAGASRAADTTTVTVDEINALKAKIADLEKRVEKTELKDAKDRMNFSGDMRFMWNSIHGGLADFRQATSAGIMPATGKIVGFHNYKLYTLRFRLNMETQIDEHFKFHGRLTMYKLFGDSTGMSIFNGQTNTFFFDGEAGRMPYDSSLRVERAYFDWVNIAGSPFYLSIGRRPSTDGPPEHMEQNSLRGGTPSAHTINYAFDGMTLGFKLYKLFPSLAGSTFRVCYGVGYEAGFRDGDLLSNDNVFNSVSADALKDSDFIGINWDVLNDEDSGTFLQLQVAWALNLTDLSPGLAVFPYAVDPATGNAYPNPTTIQSVQRMTATQNVGDVFLGNLLLMRSEEWFDWFASAAMSRTNPNGNFSNYGFGGLLCDQGGNCIDRTGYSFWTGILYPIESIDTKLGLEYNYGSKFWVNFSQGADDLVASKTATRGHVIDVFTIFDITEHAFIKINYQYFKYNYSGSGWHLGAPKDLDDQPALPFPTPDHLHNIQTAFQVNF